jgi:hypothetical protein
MPQDTPPVPIEIGTVDRSRVERLHGLARMLDSAFVVPGTNFRFGLDAIIGLIPGVGDLIGAGLSGFILVEAARIGIPKSVMLRMGWNVAVETVVGAVPFAGDLFDAAYKANNRNIRLLDRYLAQPAGVRRSSRWLVVAILAALVLLVVAVGWAFISIVRAAGAMFGG